MAAQENPSCAFSCCWNSFDCTLKDDSALKAPGNDNPADFMYPFAKSIFSTRRQGESMKARILWAVLAMIGGLAGCASGSKTFLYVTGPGTNEVFQFQRHSNGSLTALSQPTASVGSAPTSVVLTPSGNFAYIANFAGNNVTLLSVNKGNGQLTVPANTNPIPSLNPPNIFNAGTGPIAMAASTNPFLFVANQGSGDISAFTIDPKTGNLGVVSGSPFAIGGGFHPSSIAISSKGSFLYVVDSTLAQVAAFSVGSNGALTAVGAPVSVGVTPVFVAVEPTGRFVYVADKGGNAVFAFSIQSNGSLSAINGSPFTAGSQPVAIATDPQGALLYVGNHGSNNVSGFVIDANSGALGAISGSPFATGGAGPGFLAATNAFLYVGEQTTNDVAAFAIGTNGALTAVTGSPFSVATSPQWISLLP
jgi:6-phosphogluconolactonase